MALKDTLPEVQFYTEFDPYFYTVDNRPLSNLKERDDILADSIDKKIQLVDVTGAAVPVSNAIPSGWTVTRNSQGNYTITHNLNSSAYSVIGGTIVSASGTFLFNVKALTANTFTISTVSLSDVETDVRFSCILSVH